MHALIVTLYRRLDLTAPTRHLGNRKLLREGLLNKAKSGRKLRAFLCNDILLLTDEHGKNLYRMVRAKTYMLVLMVCSA
jgi:Pleckstrin homology domain